MKMHLIDPSQAAGIACNNPRARGPATADPAKVTCEHCQPDGIRVRKAGWPPFEPSTRVPRGPAGGD
jgi:hypothetical protein